MNNATGRLFLKASHKASASSGILLEHEKQWWSCAAAYQGVGAEGETEGGRRRGRASSGIHVLQGEMSCEVKVAM